MKSYFPMIGKIFPKLNINDLISVQPMTSPSGCVFYMDFKYGVRVFFMDEELWLEDGVGGEYWCPQIGEDSYMNDREFFEMRVRHLVFEEWEVDQMNLYIDGVGNYDRVDIKHPYYTIESMEKLSNLIYEKMKVGNEF